MTMHPFAHRRAARGAALLVGLVLLLVLTLTALIAMQLVSSQNRVASSAWAAQMSLDTGEAALSTAETALLNGTVLGNFAANAGGTYTLDPFTAPDWSLPGFTWSGTNVLTAATFANSQYPQSVADVIVEQLPTVAAPGQSLCNGYGCNGGILQVFRVTSRAVGPDGKLVSVVQDTSVQ
ncbi:MAG TPA: hypothetical protein VFQ95_09015 [Rhodanobacteraceae bacterium]|nr:hypothetical protein [Rhodanobacteraceae bacterium]